MIWELHLYPYLEHLTISIHEYGRADIQSVMQDICFPLNGNNPHGSFLPQLKSFTLKNLKRLSILDEMIKARYGPSQVDLMDSPSFRELVVFSVQFLDPIEEGLMTELESYFCSRKVKFDVVQDRSHNAVNL
ncbi:hypothetical protein FRC03_000521 [Tulasnella sp. 419]|nr:hypothetical protein FRC03_000521 [Tulasnella sp. 419]